jgi:branched-chain amino acid transport system substrate-binding protein
LRRAWTLLLPAILLAGCGGGGGETEDFRVSGSTLTIYSSLPRSGDSAAEAEAVAAGQRLALAESGGRVGRWRVRLVELDASEPDDHSWDPDLVLANAERAADDPTTIAYLGELEFGGSAISVPVTNQEVILQVSPHDGLTTLTRPQATPQSGPERYYPRDERTFLRLVPPDRVQAGALVAWARERGAASIAVAHDDRAFGRELGQEVVNAATAARMDVTGVEEVRPSTEGYADVVDAFAQGAPDAVVFTGMAGDAAAPLLAALAVGLPDAQLLASSGVANTAVPEASFFMTKPAFPPREYPAAGTRLLRRLERENGSPVAVEALYGYEAMKVVLDALRGAGPDAADRLAVVREALAPRSRRSVIGSYDVLRDGDVSTSRVAGYRRDRGRVIYTGPLEPDRRSARVP